MEQTFNQDLSNLKNQQCSNDNSEEQGEKLESSISGSPEDKENPENLHNLSGFYLPQIKYSQVFQSRYLDGFNYTIQKEKNSSKLPPNPQNRRVPTQRSQSIVNLEERETFQRKNEIVNNSSHLPSNELLKEAGFTDREISSRFYASSHTISRSVVRKYKKNTRRSFKSLKQVTKSLSKSKRKSHRKSRDKRIPKLSKRYMDSCNNIQHSETPFITKNRNLESKNSYNDSDIVNFLGKRSSNYIKSSFNSVKNSINHKNPNSVTQNHPDFLHQRHSINTQVPHNPKNLTETACFAVGEISSIPTRSDDKMKGLREFFKKKIVNAYNSIYHQNTSNIAEAEAHRPVLSKTEKMIQRVIIRE
ncbi:unnamed protein product [Moneuplotes crassus]|uniref:Uncharacterized protein n=1 Tax=Euplotes crassus TaxID=5936 RepID=A0AAD1Y2W1_EUPCR|nr:unnamed protein product [Moneuplotes crassus]